MKKSTKYIAFQSRLIREIQMNSQNSLLLLEKNKVVAIFNNVDNSL